MRFVDEDNNEAYELTEKGRAHADQREPDGSRTCLREGREHYAAGNLRGGDAMVVLLSCRAYELNDEALLREAWKLREIGDAMRVS